MPDREGFQFPLLIPLKVIGHNTGDFERVVYHLVQRHIPELEREALSSQTSTGGKYVSVTVTFSAQSREQLEAIYQELKEHELVVMTL
jgi:putative lipoic acid-binding regulatory protein